jgi:hypothetical protein
MGAPVLEASTWPPLQTSPLKHLANAKGVPKTRNFRRLRPTPRRHREGKEKSLREYPAAIIEGSILTNASRYTIKLLALSSGFVVGSGMLMTFRRGRLTTLPKRSYTQ